MASITKTVKPASVQKVLSWAEMLKTNGKLFRLEPASISRFYTNGSRVPIYINQPNGYIEPADSSWCNSRFVEVTDETLTITVP